MSLLVFQVVIKQWDKSQRSVTDVAARATLPSRYTIDSQPAYFVLNKACIIDLHGDDLPTSVFKNGRIKTAMLPDGCIGFDRFQLCSSKGVDVLAYLPKAGSQQIIGPLDQGWIQCRYHWRYAVEEGGQNYWMYEELILNAACLQEFDASYFLHTEPRITFEDV